MAGVLAGLVAAGIVFAGSEDRIPAGVSVLGVKLSGLTPAEAQAKLERRAAGLADVPVVLAAAGKRFELRPSRLDVRVDWAAVVVEARAAGDGPLPLRGLERLRLRLFGFEVEPHATLYEAGLDLRLARIARLVDNPAREAALELKGLAPKIVPAETGRKLDAEAARRLVVAALASFDRRAVPLPVEVDLPKVTAETLRPVLAQARTALSAPVRLGYGGTHWRLAPRELAGLLLLPSGGSAALRIGGPVADRYFNELGQAFDRRPEDAGFKALENGSVRVVPGVDGRALDAVATAKALLAAALRERGRTAELVIRAIPPARTTEEARALGITTAMASFATAYAGTADRIHNLQLAVSLIDGALVAPGKEFSLNETVGPRTLERGFRVAPVIVGGEYEEDVGGGTSQVATTVFNAAWEAGLKITERNPHALYISRYPDGRDATVNYPDLDLRFLNDTKHWILVEGSYDDAGITVTLLGPRTGRRVLSESGPLEEVAPPKLEKVLDPTLFKGERVVEEEGQPARAITVTRKVYRGDEILYDEVWNTRYRSESRVVRLGTKPKPAEVTPPAEEPAPATTEPAVGARVGPERRVGAPGVHTEASISSIRALSAPGIRVGRRVAASTQACEVQPSATMSPSRSIM